MQIIFNLFSTKPKATLFEVDTIKLTSFQRLSNSKVVAGSAAAPKKLEVLHT